MDVKGTIISALPKHIREQFGKEGMQRWLNAITPQARAIFTSNIDEGGWYPLKTALIEPFANLAQLFYNWDLKKAAWEFGRFSAESRFKGMALIMAKLGSLNLFVSKAGDYLLSCYRPCAVEVPENADKKALVRITHFPEMDKSTEFRIAGWMQRGLEINGCKNVQVEILKSLVNLDRYTEYRLTWE